jgi:hypothetical protein
MCYEKAAKSVYKVLSDPNTYPIRSLNQFKTDPRVKVGPRYGVGDDWAIFDFAAGLRRSRGRWFVFQARSRFYAVDAKSARDARRIIEHYQPIRMQPDGIRAADGDGASVNGVVLPQAVSNSPRLPKLASPSTDGFTGLRFLRGRFLRVLASRQAQLESRPRLQSVA